ncbi:type VII secretion protein EccB [Lapillicoccus jejuensis]|uniref:Type VII secretion protein EccB n=1 Tax=Lapillicoccus jejuensis TaxID=402171 RepID=A0A542E0J3_9MICO|nr:type VII secretion protein EccB [Lapillicoccus jejuensis]TQJ08836.1 type VII secretion protein EccB [Lapillicoccus jejuensis]
MTAGPDDRSVLGPRPPVDRGTRDRLVRSATRDPARCGVAPAGGRGASRERRRWPAFVGGVLVTSVLVAVVSVVAAVRAPARTALAEGDLLVGRVSAARYLELGGRLHPVLNVASARLVTTTAPRTVVVDDEVLTSMPHGPTLGIAGAPDDLPAPDRLLPTAGWLACADGPAVRLRLGDGGGRTGSASPTTTPTTTPSTAPASAPTTASTAPGTGSGSLPAATVVGPGPSPVRYLLVDGRRLALPPGAAAALTDAVGRSAPTQPLPAALLDLFPPGTPLDAASLTLGPGVGAALPASLRRPGVERVGQLVRTGGSTAVALADGLLPLDPFAAAVYAATAPSALGHPVELAEADLGSVPLSDHDDPAPDDWPRERPGPRTGTPCAGLAPAVDGATAATTLVLTPPTSPTAPTPPAATAAAPAPGSADPPDGAVRATVDVPPGGGALVRVGPAGADGPVLLVDGTGTAFPVADPVEQTLSRLGYSGQPVPSVPAAWAALLPRGPELSIVAAGRGPR